MLLQAIDDKWSSYLTSENCPPVLGLAPLAEDESEAIYQIVKGVVAKRDRPQWRTLFDLLEIYPACLIVWLARKAGEAYEAGAFWERFGELIGLSIPLTQREELAQRFRRASRRKMVT
ncbi:MAG: hypothetical protein MSG64_20280 [Pyrinomonadaceae bacterium MAG19_C2-C3]|nr:hypothetical protein [Pyrinomonadaceae bacterium MAG19_C2-C3]